MKNLYLEASKNMKNLYLGAFKNMKNLYLALKYAPVKMK